MIEFVLKEPLVESNVVWDGSCLKRWKMDELLRLPEKPKILVARDLSQSLAEGTLLREEGRFFELLDAQALVLEIENPWLYMAHESEFREPYSRPSRRVNERSGETHGKSADVDEAIARRQSAAMGEAEKTPEDSIEKMVFIVEIFRLQYLRRLRGAVNLDDAKMELELQIAGDPEFVAMHFSKISRFAEKEALFPDATVEFMGGGWASYRFLQVWNLLALEYAFRYSGVMSIREMPDAHENLRRDMRDAQHLVAALLEGAFATSNEKFRRWWRLLSPSGLLLPTRTDADMRAARNT